MNIKKLLMASTLLAGVTGLANVADASELNSVDTIKAEMHKQQGNQQHLAVYRVQKGDTLSGIAEASGLTIHQILEMNDIPNPNLIYVGQLINLGYGNQAQQFVAKQGQSSEQNAKEYQVPTSKKAQNAMNQTKGNSIASNLGTSYQPVASTNVHGGVSNGQTSQGTVSNGSAQTPAQGNQQLIGGNEGTTQTPSQGQGNNNGGSTTPEQPSQPSQGGNQGGTQNPSTPDKPSHGGNTGNNTPNQPSKPDQGGSQEQAKLDANKINQSVQDTLTNDYGWKGTWMDSKDGYDQAVNDWQNNWEASTTDGYYVDGYATASVGKVDKNSNTTMGSQMAGSINNNKDNHYQDYKYGYTHTTTDGNSAKTDYYFWN